MSWARRVLRERAALAVNDLEGEREAVSPVPGSVAFWENELARPLRGAATMDRDIAERIATALEQIALELAADTNVSTLPPPYTYTPLAPLQPADWHPQPIVQQSIVPPTCPVHGKPWRAGNKPGAAAYYCATRLADGSWCQQHPQVA